MSREAIINVPKLEAVVERLRKGLANLDFEGKRQVLDAMSIVVWLDVERVDVNGTINMED